MTDREGVIARHGGYRRLKSFQVAQLVYDVTVRFCERYINRRSRTRDQMVQAARSGVQNIAEGSQAAGTSKKTELRLTSVARASLEELRLDYEDFLRQRGLPRWERQGPRRAELIDRRPASVEDVARWVREVHARARARGPSGRSGPGGQCGPDQPGESGERPTEAAPSTYPEIAANAALTLVAVATGLLDRQLWALASAFEREGGFTERLYRIRTAHRRHHGPGHA